MSEKQDRKPSLRVEYDRSCGCAYVDLQSGRSGEYAWTERLDQERAIDWDAAGEPLGLDFMNASTGVDLSGIPYANQVAKALRQHGIPVLETAAANPSR